jgi:hypothetical protein
MSTHNEDIDAINKRKKGWVTTFLLLTFGWWLFSFAVVMIKYNISDFSVSFTSPGISVVISNFLSAIVCFYLMFRMNKLYRARKSIINLIMANYFLVVAIPAVTNGVISFMQFDTLPLQTFMELSAFYLVPGSWLFLAFFIIETFNGGIEKKKSSALFYIPLIITILAFGVILWLNLLDPETPAEGVTLLVILGVGALALGLSLFLYYLLAIKSYKLKKRMEEAIYKKGLVLLGWSGIFISTNAFGRILSLLIVNPEIYPTASLILNIALDIIYLIGYIFFYLGVTIPMTRKK